jgi:hypothetical protein
LNNELKNRGIIEHRDNPNPGGWGPIGFLKLRKLVTPNGLNLFFLTYMYYLLNVSELYLVNGLYKIGLLTLFLLLLQVRPTTFFWWHIYVFLAACRVCLPVAWGRI